MKGIVFSLLISLSMILTGCQTIKSWYGSKAEDKSALTWNQDAGRWQPSSDKYSIVSKDQVLNLDDGIHIKIKSKKNLNNFKGYSHPIYARIVQLADLKVFTDLSRTKTGLKQLLDEGYSDSSFLQSKIINIEPSRDFEIKVDRVENSTALGLVFGFYNLNGMKSSRIISIPPNFTIKETLFEKIKGMIIKSEEEKTKDPKMFVDIILDENEIEKMEIIAKS
jgi:predicted component of type VI protein secretion system